MSVLHDLIEDIKGYKEARKQGNKREARKKLGLSIFTGFAVALTLAAAITFVVTIIRWFITPQPIPQTQSISQPQPSPQPQAYKIAVVGPKSGSEKLTWDYILQGISKAQNNEHVGNLQGASLQLIYFDDAGNTAATQNIANTICADKSYVLVMGFVESNVAKRALPIYGKNDCGIPVILIATTSTTLTEANQKQWTAPILRLAPSNYQQAVQVVAALGDTYGTKPCRLVAFIDNDNAAYSDNLLEQFKKVKGLDKRTRCTIQPQDEITYKQSNLEQTLTQKLSANPSADVILFLGMTDKAVQMLQVLAKVRQTLHFPQTKPIVILSDGSTTADLIDKAQGSAKCVWGSFPFGEARDFIDNMPKDLKNIPSYYAYGHDAMLIAMNTISDVGGNVSRETLREEFKKLATEKEFLRGMNGYYEFSSDGGLRFLLDVNDPNHVLGQYHLWQVRFQDGKLKWDHRTWRESLETGCGD